MKKILFIALAAVITSVSCSPKLSPDAGWGNQRWVLTELKGVPVQLSGSRKDAFIEFSPADKRFSGNGGCNRINGSYTVEKKDHISLGEVVSTKMSCNDISFENAFLSTLSDVNRFETDGGVLLMKKNKEVILRFETRARGN